MRTKTRGNDEGGPAELNLSHTQEFKISGETVKCIDTGEGAIWRKQIPRAD